MTGAHQRYDEATEHPDITESSVGQLIGEVTSDLSTLLRQELELAKAKSSKR